MTDELQQLKNDVKLCMADLEEEVKQGSRQLEKFADMFKESNAKMTEALVKIAENQEKTLSLNQRTADLHKDVDCLFERLRLNEMEIVAHKHSDSDHPVITESNTKWDKMQVSFYTAAVLGAITFIYNVAVGLLEKVNAPPPTP